MKGPLIRSNSVRLPGNVEAVQAQLERDLAHDFEARLAQQGPHGDRVDAVDLALSHSAAPVFILVKDQMREAAGPRSDHRRQEETVRPEHAPHREERRLAVRNVVEGRHHTHRVEGPVAEWQLSRISDPDIDAVPGEYVNAETDSVGAGEVVVSAGKVEEAPADKRQHHAEAPRLEKVHPVPCGFLLRPLRLNKHGAGYHGSAGP